MIDLSDTAATLAIWESRGKQWCAILTRNFAGAWYLAEQKHNRPCGGRSRPSGFFPNDGAAIEWASIAVGESFDVTMYRVS